MLQQVHWASLTSYPAATTKMSGDGEAAGGGLLAGCVSETGGSERKALNRHQLLLRRRNRVELDREGCHLRREKDSQDFRPPTAIALGEPRPTEFPRTTLSPAPTSLGHRISVGRWLLALCQERAPVGQFPPHSFPALKPRDAPE